MKIQKKKNFYFLFTFFVFYFKTEKKQKVMNLITKKRFSCI